MENNDEDYSAEIPPSIPGFGGGNLEERLARAERLYFRLLTDMKNVQLDMKLMASRQRRLVGWDGDDSPEKVDTKISARSSLFDFLEAKRTRGASFGKWLWGMVGTFGLMIGGAVITRAVEYLTGSHK